MGCDIHIYAEVKRDGKWQRAEVAVPDERNYWTFSLMADVRNGYGFAGSPTGKAVTPIAQPRGLPEDCATSDSDGDIDYDEPGYVWLGDHSHSWLTLRELQSVDLDAPITQCGVISKEQKTALEAGKLPDGWCAMKSPMTEDDVHATWQRPTREAAWLLPKIIEALQPLGEPDEVRVVFGFDS